MLSDISLQVKKYDGLYTTLPEAVAELERRRHSRQLAHAIHADIKLTPELHTLVQQKNAVMFRQVATPIHEILHMLRSARHVQLSPFIIEYHKDKFVSSGNIFKRGLGKLPIVSHHWGERTCAYTYRRIIDFNSQIGKPLDEVLTVQGEPLIRVHHELFEAITGTDLNHISGDGTTWFQQWGTARAYYAQFLKIFIRDAILFENFVTTPEEALFTTTVVQPAFYQVEQEYGYTPLVIRVAPETEEQSPYWNCYPKSVDALLTRKLYS